MTKSNDPTPLSAGLADGEDFYLADDLDDAEWEVRTADGTVWYPPSSSWDQEILIARRKRWTPQVGETVLDKDGDKLIVWGVRRHWAWVGTDEVPSGYPAPIFALRPLAVES